MSIGFNADDFEVVCDERDFIHKSKIPKQEVVEVKKEVVEVKKEEVINESRIKDSLR